MALFFFIVGFVAFLISLWFKTTDCFKALADTLYMTRYGVYALRCEHCNRWSTLLHSTVRAEESRTSYNYDGKWFSKANPNRPQLLCCCCSEQHHDYWDEMWSDYIGSTTGYSYNNGEPTHKSRCKHVTGRQDQGT